MKTSFVSIVMLAAATMASALPSNESKHQKPGPIDITTVKDQCQEGEPSCCSLERNVEDKSLLALLNGFDLLGAQAVCSPVNVLGHLNVNILGEKPLGRTRNTRTKLNVYLGSFDDKNGNVDCTHTVSCCTGKKVFHLNDFETYIHSF